MLKIPHYVSILKSLKPSMLHQKMLGIIFCYSYGYHFYNLFFTIYKISISLNMYKITEKIFKQLPLTDVNIYAIMLGGLISAFKNNVL